MQRATFRPPRHLVEGLGCKLINELRVLDRLIQGLERSLGCDVGMS